jgi:hypothetical protein
MPLPVVDRLEMVDIEHQRRKILARLPGLLLHVPTEVQECRAIQIRVRPSAVAIRRNSTFGRRRPASVGIAAE